MRYTAPEKLEIIELVERSSVSVRRTLAPLGIPRSTFYGWYRRYAEGGVEAWADRPPRPQRAWNRIPPERTSAIVDLALSEPALSPRELAVKYTDTDPLLRVRIDRVPAPEGEGPHCKPRLHRAAGGGSVPPANHPGESIVTDRLYVLESHWLGLVLPVHGA